MKKIDVIIPTYRPGSSLEELLRRLEQQSCPPDHIIIMNTEKKYWNPRLEEKFSRMQVHHLTKDVFDHGGTRDAGARLSRADVLVFMTQDAMPANNLLLEKLSGALEQKGVAVAYARQLPQKDCRLIEQYTRDFNYPSQSRVKFLEDLPRLGIKTYFCSNVCAAYNREIYEKSGGFVKHTIFNEDMIYAAGVVKAGYGVAYEAEAQVIHSHNYTGCQQLHRNFDLGVSQAQHPEIFRGVPAEGEGMRLIKKTISFLLQQKRPHLILLLFWQSGCKYLGYLLGKNYRKLPNSWIQYLTDNRQYWEKGEKNLQDA